MNPFKYISATDIDGTLFRDDRTVSVKDMDTLRMLGERGICRVAATGRNYWSFLKLAGEDFPIDYFIFSCGAGIMEWKTKKVIYSSCIDEEKTAEVREYLNSVGADFCVCAPIPDNHFYFPYRTGRLNPALEARCAKYSSFCMEKDTIKESPQFIAVFPEGNYDEIVSAAAERLPGVGIVRSTSPMDGKSLWLEIYGSGVSKSAGLCRLTELFGTDRQNVMAVGNDYNDADMLEWAGFGYITANSPEVLRKKFFPVPSNNESGFSAAVSHWLEIIGH